MSEKVDLDALEKVALVAVDPPFPVYEAQAIFARAFDPPTVLAMIAELRSLRSAPPPPVQPSLEAEATTPKEPTPGIDPQPSWGGRKSKEFGEVLEEGRGAALPSWMRGGGQ
jgi:hypothetical protein